MKKTVILILVLVLAVVVLASCTKKNEEVSKSALLNYTVYNRTGETVSEFAVEDKKGEAKMTVEGMSDGVTSPFSITVTVDDTGTPNLQVSYRLQSGNSVMTILNEKTDAITLLPGTIEFKAPAE